MNLSRTFFFLFLQSFWFLSSFGQGAFNIPLKSGIYSTNDPLSAVKQFNYNAYIYLNREINIEGALDSIGFFCTSTNAANPVRAKIYFKLLNQNDSVFKGPVSISEFREHGELVFDGIISGKNFRNNSWMSIGLNRPFYYDTSFHLAVLVEAIAVDGQLDNSYNKYFREHSAKANRHAQLISAVELDSSKLIANSKFWSRQDIRFHWLNKKINDINLHTLSVPNLNEQIPDSNEKVFLTFSKLFDDTLLTPNGLTFYYQNWGKNINYKDSVHLSETKIYPDSDYVIEIENVNLFPEGVNCFEVSLKKGIDSILYNNIAKFKLDVDYLQIPYFEDFSTPKKLNYNYTYGQYQTIDEEMDIGAAKGTSSAFESGYYENMPKGNFELTFDVLLDASKVIYLEKNHKFFISYQMEKSTNWVVLDSFNVPDSNVDVYNGTWRKPLIEIPNKGRFKIQYRFSAGNQFCKFRLDNVSIKPMVDYDLELINVQDVKASQGNQTNGYEYSFRNYGVKPIIFSQDSVGIQLTLAGDNGIKVHTDWIKSSDTLYAGELYKHKVNIKAIYPYVGKYKADADLLFVQDQNLNNNKQQLWFNSGQGVVNYPYYDGFESLGFDNWNYLSNAKPQVYSANGYNGSAGLKFLFTSNGEWLHSPLIKNVGDSALLSFSYHSTYQFGLYVSKDYGVSFDLIDTVKTNKSNGVLKHAEYDLSKYKGEDVIIRISKVIYNPTIILDNFSLTRRSPFDTDILKVNNFENNSCYKNARAKLEITNRKSKTIDFSKTPLIISVTEIGGNLYTWHDTLRYGQVQENKVYYCYIANGINLSSGGKRTFKVEAHVQGEKNLDGNSAFLQFMDINPQSPIVHEFIKNDNNWNNASHRTYLKGSFISKYSNGKSSEMSSPMIMNISNESTVHFRLETVSSLTDLSAKQLGPKDYVKIYVSNDCGSTYNLIHTINSNNAIEYLGNKGFGLSLKKWANSGVIVKIEWYSDSGAYLLLDNFEINSNPLHANWLQFQPLYGCQPGLDSLKLSFTNHLKDTISLIDSSLLIKIKANSISSFGWLDSFRIASLIVPPGKSYSTVLPAQDLSANSFEIELNWKNGKSNSLYDLKTSEKAITLPRLEYFDNPDKIRWQEEDFTIINGSLYLRAKQRASTYSTNSYPILIKSDSIELKLNYNVSSAGFKLKRGDSIIIRLKHNCQPLIYKIGKIDSSNVSIGKTTKWVNSFYLPKPDIGLWFLEFVYHKIDTTKIAHIYFDEVSIKPKYKTDLVNEGFQNFKINPCALTELYPIVKLKNHGTDSLILNGDSILVQFKIDQNNYESWEVIDSLVLPPGGTFDVVSKKKFILSQNDILLAQSQVIWLNDANKKNNYSSRNFDHSVSATGMSSPPFFEEFDGKQDWWTHVGIGTDGTKSAQSYFNQSASNFIAPLLFGANSNTWLSFDYRLMNNVNYPNLPVTNQKQLNLVSEKICGTDTVKIIDEFLAAEEGGNVKSYDRYYAKIESLSGDCFRASIAGAGFTKILDIDNLLVKDYYNDLWLTGVAAALELCDTNRFVTLQILNNGIDTVFLTNKHLLLSGEVLIDDTLVIYDSLSLSSGIIAPHDTLFWVFDRSLNIENSSHLLVKFKLLDYEDDDPFNNELRWFEQQRAVSFSIPYIEDFETVPRGSYPVGWSSEKTFQNFNNMFFLFGDTFKFISPTLSKVDSLTEVIIDFHQNDPKFEFYCDLWVSENCGKSWTYLTSDTVNEKNTQQNIAHRMALKAFVGKDVKVKLIISSNNKSIYNSTDLWLNKIEVKNPSRGDLNARQIQLASPNDCRLGLDALYALIESHSVAFDFNRSPCNISIDLKGDDFGAYKATIDSGILKPFSTLKIKIADGLDLTKTGQYTFSGSIGGIQDDYKKNNAFPDLIVNQNKLNSLPHNETFVKNNLPNDWSTTMNLVWKPIERSYSLNQSINDSVSAHVISPFFDLTRSKNPYLSFSAHTSQSVLVYISTTCGTSFKLLDSFSSNSNTKGIHTLRSVNLNRYKGQAVSFKFVFKGSTSSSYNEQVEFDNFSIQDALHDLAIVGMRPSLQSCIGDSTKVEVGIKNQGLSTWYFTNDTAKISLDFAGTSSLRLDSSIVMDSLQVNDTLWVAFHSKVFTKTARTYALNFSLSSSTDDLEENNQLENQLIKRRAVQHSPYLDPISSLGSLKTNWELKHQNKVSKIGQKSGYALKAELNSNGETWLQNENLFKIKPNDQLYFNYYLGTDSINLLTNGLDSLSSLQIQYSKDCGNSYVNLSKINKQTINGRSGFLSQAFNIDSLAGETLRFRMLLSTKNPVVFLVDNFGLGVSPIDLSVDSLVTNLNNTCGDTANALSMVVKNMGHDTITSFGMRIVVKSKKVDTLKQVFSGMLKPGQSQTIFVGKINTSSGGNYEITSFIDLNSDFHIANNSRKDQISWYQKPFLSLGNDTSICYRDSLKLGVQPKNGLKYKWNTGDTSQVIHIEKQGNYSVVVTDSNGCRQSDSVNINIDMDCAWPGDVNLDREVNNHDVLYLALKYGKSGPKRNPTDSSWKAWVAPNWNDTFSTGINSKHADCDGNGLISYLDTSVVSLNYSKTRSYKKTANKRAGDYDLKFVIKNDSLSPGDTSSIFIYASDTSNLIKNLHGIAWTINYDETIIAGIGKLNSTNNWLVSTFEDRLSYGKSDKGATHYAFARTDSFGTHGGGLMFELEFYLKDSFSVDKHIFFEPSLILGLSSSQDTINFNAKYDSSWVARTSVTRQETVSNDISIYPNPFSEIIWIDGKGSGLNSVEVLNLNGQVLIQQMTSGDKTKLDLRSLYSGVYFVQIHLESGKVLMEKVIKLR